MKNSVNATRARQLKVTFVESTARLGGVEHSTILGARGLASRGWAVRVVSPEDGPLLERCRAAGLATAVVPLTRLWSVSVRRCGRVVPNPLALPYNYLHGWFWSKRIAELLVETRPHVVVSKGMSSHIFAGAAARSARVPLVWHVQDLVSPGFLSSYKSVFNLLGRFLPDSIICDGSAIKTSFGRDVRSKCTVVVNGVDLDRFNSESDGQAIRREFGIPRDAVVVGNVARLTPWKGQDYLVRAFSRVASNGNTWLVLVGSALFDNGNFERKLKALVRKKGIENRVVFPGYRTDLARVLAAFDIFAYSSVRKDTSPLSLLSALASGLPVVAFKIDGIEEILGGCGCATLVRCGDTAGMARAIAELTQRPQQRSDMGQAARALARQRLGLETHLRSIEDILLEVIWEAR